MDDASFLSSKEFNKLPKNIGKVNHKKPMTGDEYIEELVDGREVFIYGKDGDWT